MSTRVEGTAPPVILLTAKAMLAAAPVCLMLTVIEESANLWRYNLSERKNSRIAYGRIIVSGHMAALRRAAEILRGRLPARQHRAWPARRIRPGRVVTIAAIITAVRA